MAAGARNRGGSAGARGRQSWVRAGGRWVRGEPREAGAGGAGGAPGGGGGAAPGGPAAAAAPAAAAPRPGLSAAGGDLSWVRTEKGWVRGRLAPAAGGARLARRGRSPEPGLNRGQAAALGGSRELPDLADVAGRAVLEGLAQPSADPAMGWSSPAEVGP